MNEDSCLNFTLHNLDEKSSNNESKHYHGDESNSLYLKYLNDKKKNNELENGSLYQNLVKEIEKLKKYNGSLIKDLNGLRQQCRAAIQQWDKTLRENNETKDHLIQMQQQRDEALKKINHEISQRLKVAKDLTRLTEERNSAVHEYNLIMSERDSVHKEMEKLTEELGQYQKKIKTLDQEKKNLVEEMDNLKKEINNRMRLMDKEFLIIQMYREKYNHEFNLSSFQNGFKSIHSNTKWGSTSSSGFSSGWVNPYGNFKNPLSLSSTNSNINSLQTFNPIDEKQKNFSLSNSSSFSTMGHKNEMSDHELELKKQIRVIEFEYNNVQSDFQNCLLQNEKVVQERESIKTLCDKLRRERDRAIRDRAEALQDLNDFRLKIESNAQIKKYIDDLNDVNNLSDQNKRQINNQASSKDSAISADIHDTQQIDYENLNILLVNNFRHNKSKFKNAWGFSIRSQDRNVLVSGLNLDSPAEDKLKLNDIILSINSINVTSEQMVNELLCKYDKELQLVVQRRRQMSSVLNVNLDCSKNEHGLVVENAFLIKKFLHDSESSKNENISIGDRLLSINGNTLENSTIHDVMQLLREDKLILKVYKQSLNKQNNCSSSSSMMLNENCDLRNGQTDSHKFLSNLNSTITKPIYQKDDLHLTTFTNKQQSNYSNIGHYQSIKRSSKKSKTLLNDSSSSFGTEYDKGSPTLLDKTFNKLFKKSIKSKNDKKDEKLKMKKLSPEKKTLDDFNKILNNLSERDSKKKLFSDKSIVIDKEKTGKNSGGTWPSCNKSNSNLLSSQTYGKINLNAAYSKKKERKSLSIFANYQTKANESTELNYEDNKIFNDQNDKENKSNNHITEYGKDYGKDYKNFNDYQHYGMIQQSNNKTLSSRTNTPVDNYKSSSTNPNKHNERSLSSSISSYSSKDNHFKSNNGKKYTLNHQDIIYKSINAPSSNTSIQLDQDYQMKKSKEKKYLDSMSKQSKMDNDQLSYLSNQQRSYTDLEDEKNSKETLSQLQRDINRHLNSPSIGFYSVTNKRQLITSNQTSNYSQDLESYLINNGLVDQGSSSTFGILNADEETSTSNSFFFTENLMNQKKSSPININQFKALNRLSIVSSPSHFSNDNVLSNSPSSHYATFSTSNNNNLSAHQQSNKDNYCYSNNGKQNIYDRSSLYGYLNHQPIHQLQNNPVKSISSLSSNIYQQDDFESPNKNHRRSYNLSSNNSVASKLSNCSMDSNTMHMNAMNSSSNYFKKVAANESFDSTSYSNIQNLRHVEILSGAKNLSLDKKLLPSNKITQKQLQQLNKKQMNLSIDRSIENGPIDKAMSSNSDFDIKVLESDGLDNYSADAEDLKLGLGHKRTICIEKAEKSLGIQIACGKAIPGIFISYVDEDSLAKKVGLKVGDQLLEYCGINMRSATASAAASVLRQSKGMVNMKVQYNPDKFFGKEFTDNKVNQMVRSESGNELNNQETKIERETNLDGSIKDRINDKKDFEDTLKNFI